MVVAGSADTEVQHTQNMGPKPQKHNQPCAISWAHPAPTLTQTPLLPFWGCSYPPPPATLDLKALHWRDLPHPRARDWPGCAMSVLHNTGIAHTGALSKRKKLEFHLGRKGCAWTHWKLYTGVAVPSGWTCSPTGPLETSVPLFSTEGAASTFAPLLTVLSLYPGQDG